MCMYLTEIILHLHSIYVCIQLEYSQSSSHYAHESISLYEQYCLKLKYNVEIEKYGSGSKVTHFLFRKKNEKREVFQCNYVFMKVLQQYIFESENKAGTSQVMMNQLTAKNNRTVKRRGG